MLFVIRFLLLTIVGASGAIGVEPKNPCEDFLPQAAEFKTGCDAFEAGEVTIQARAIESVESGVYRCARTARVPEGARLQVGFIEYASRREAEGAFLFEEKKARESPGTQRIPQVGDRALRYRFEGGGFFQDRLIFLKDQKVYTFQTPIRKATEGAKASCTPSELEAIARSLLTRIGRAES